MNQGWGPLAEGKGGGRQADLCEVREDRGLYRRTEEGAFGQGGMGTTQERTAASRGLRGRAFAARGQELEDGLGQYRALGGRAEAGRGVRAARIVGQSDLFSSQPLWARGRGCLLKGVLLFGQKPERLRLAG